MADIRNDREREELHKAIWSIADDLRGSVDGWDFKQYVLGVMFYRYISENLTNYINEGEHAAGDVCGSKTRLQVGPGHVFAVCRFSAYPVYY